MFASSPPDQGLGVVRAEDERHSEDKPEEINLVSSGRCNSRVALGFNKNRECDRSR